ncbi:hypothetical protein V5799_011443 [Amblyomma americanum]|uniref:Uncharacterized protein n=1 Tax=Amblyomma americanum TaxID=6943 RepID=A0AAQ4EGW6_AMBAM
MKTKTQLKYCHKLKVDIARPRRCGCCPTCRKQRKYPGPGHKENGERDRDSCCFNEETHQYNERPLPIGETSSTAERNAVQLHSPGTCQRRRSP